MSAIPLHPRLDSEVKEFLEQEIETVFDLTNAFGSPVHLVFPQLLKKNAESLQEVLNPHGTGKNEIFFASKVNKAESFIEEAANSGIGVDVSSLQELRSALGHGVLGERISVSGPSKKERLLALAVQHNCTISIDSDLELDALISLVKKTQNLKSSVLLRLSNLSSTFTRFGIQINNLPSILTKILDNSSGIDLKGFHFHLSGYAPEERISALQKTIDELIKARSVGHTCNTINIGGGFAVRYVESADWEKFESSRNPHSFAGSKDLKSFYPYGGRNDAVEQISMILSTETNTHDRISNLLKSSNINLAIEPGRSLVDQAGITCMQVKGIKQASDGTYIIEVDANINHLSEQWFGSDYCVDPLHLSKEANRRNDPMEAAIAGNTCLEIDMISWRKIGFATRPVAGDILVFPNTAGYQMDSNESSFHQLPIPEKLAVFKKDNSWKWKKDSEYSFLDPK